MEYISSSNRRIDIDGGIAFSTVKDDLGTIGEAVNYFIKRLESATDEA